MLFSRQDLASTRAEAPPKDEAYSVLCLSLRYVVHAWAAMMYAFTRRSLGRCFFNFWGMSGLLVLSFWAVVTTPPEEALPRFTPTQLVTMRQHARNVSHHRARAGDVGFRVPPDRVLRWMRLFAGSSVLRIP